MNNCRVCDAQIVSAPIEAQEMMYGLGDRHLYYQCDACGCLQIGQFPADIERYYGDSYYSFQAPSATGLRARLVQARNRYSVFRDNPWGALLYRLMPTQHFGFLQPLVGKLTPDTRLLDVGCGSGALPRSLKSVGFKHVLGVDPFVAEDIRLEGELLVRKGWLDEVQGVFDVVMFHHSLEHMPEQRPVLQRARQLLPDGGHCIVRIPLVSSLAWERYRANWVQLDAPRHFYLHSVRSMELLAKQAGFEVAGVIHDSTDFQFWGSEQYARGIPLNDPRSFAVNPAGGLFSPADIERFKLNARRVNAEQRGDQAVFYLRKPTWP